MDTLFRIGDVDYLLHRPERIRSRVVGGEIPGTSISFQFPSNYHIDHDLSLRIVWWNRSSCSNQLSIHDGFCGHLSSCSSTKSTFSSISCQKSALSATLSTSWLTSFIASRFHLNGIFQNILAGLISTKRRNLSCGSSCKRIERG